MSIKWRINPGTFMDEVEIARVEKTIALLKLEEVTVIDSYTMSPNGPILLSIFLLSGGYLAEVRMGGKHLQFDVSPAKVLANYRVSYGEHDVQIDALAAAAEAEAKAPAALAKPTKFVSVTLRHTETLVTTMNFFGEDVERWVDFVLEAYPPKLALGS